MIVILINGSVKMPPLRKAVNRQESKQKILPRFYCDVDLRILYRRKTIAVENEIQKALAQEIGLPKSLPNPWLTFIHFRRIAQFNPRHIFTMKITANRNG